MVAINVFDKAFYTFWTILQAVCTDGLAAMTLAFQANNSGSNPDRCIITFFQYGALDGLGFGIALNE